MDNHWKISYVSVTSLKMHHEDVSHDNAINDSDILGIGENWLEKNERVTLDEYIGYSANRGKGKGQAGLGGFTKIEFDRKLIAKPKIVVSSKYSGVLLKTSTFNIIFLYLSAGYPRYAVVTFLENWISDKDFPTAIVGNMNENILGKTKSKFQKFMQSKNFHQIIQEPTFLRKSLIDHLYVNEPMQKRHVFYEKNPCSYSDHDILSLYIPK